jgi:hypothetical protein
MKTIAVILTVLFAFQNNVSFMTYQVSDVRQFGLRAFDISSTKGRRDGELVIRREMIKDEAADSKTGMRDVYIMYFFRNYNKELKCYKAMFSDTMNYKNVNFVSRNDSIQFLSFYDPSKHKQSPNFNIHFIEDKVMMDTLTEEESRAIMLNIMPLYQKKSK